MARVLRIRRPARVRGWVTLLALAVCAVGAGSSVLAAGQAKRLRDTSLEANFDRRASAASAAVAGDLKRYISLLQITAAGLSAQPTLTSDVFATVTWPFAGNRLPGASGVALVVPATDAQVSAVQADWRSRGNPGLTLQPASTGREHLFGVLSRPLDGGTSTLGRDVSQIPEPTAAMALARRTGTIAVSDTYVLLKDRVLAPSEQQLSFAIAAPVYAPAAAGGGFRGWLTIGFRGQSFISGTLSGAAEGLLDVTLSAEDAAGRPVQVAALDVGSPDASLRRTMAVPVAQSQWQLTVTATESAKLAWGGATYLPGTVLAGGLLITLLLAGLVVVLATARDRADAKVRRATVELSDAERRATDQAGLLTAIMNSIGDGVAVVDSGGHFLLHNPAAARLFGRDVEPSVGPIRWPEPYGLFRPDGASRFPVAELPLARALAGEEALDEILLRTSERPEGTLVQVTARPLEASTGQSGAVAVFHDITELRRHEAELAAFAGVAAHDLKSPLTAINGFIDLLADDPNLDEDSLLFVGRIQAAVARMRHLIDDLLAFASARDAELDLQQVDLKATVDDVVAARTDHLRAAGGQLFPDIYVGALPAVEADPQMVRQLLDNLVGNALKYVQPGRPARVDISAAPVADGLVRVQVADRGIGIPAEHQDRVFASFHRAHRGGEYSGTGLGLAICQRIVDRHGGTIGVTENPGGGSQFWFTLPAAAATGSPDAAGPRSAVPAEPAEAGSAVPGT